MADDPLPAALADALEAIDVAPYSVVIATARQLLAAVDAVLKLAPEWESDAAELDRDVVKERVSQYQSDREQAFTDESAAGTLRECATALREAIARELAGEGKADG